jgi:hypothetical protein
MQDKYKNGLLKDHIDAIDYISKYWFETNILKMYYFWDAEQDNFEFRDDKGFKFQVLDKLEQDKDVLTYFKRNSKIYRIVSTIDKPRHYKIGNRYYINECRGLLHKNFKPYSECSNETKENVDLMNNFVKDVFCNNDDEIFNAFTKHWSQVVRGKKTGAIIYNKAKDQGVGKTTFITNFLRPFVTGEKLCCLSNTDPLLTLYNKIYMGKLLVIFEELPTFSENQWNAVSSKLKTMCTENAMMFSDKFEKSIEAQNLLNFAINTNVDEFKNSDGRRIIIMPINSKYKGNKAFWEKINKKV